MTKPFLAVLTLAAVCAAGLNAQYTENYNSNNNVKGLALVADSLLYAGTSTGLVRWNLASGKSELVDLGGILSDPAIGFVTADEWNNLWVVADNDEIATFDGTGWKAFDPEGDGIRLGIVRGIDTQPDSSLWIASWSEGIYRLKNGQWSHPYSSVNLPDGYIHGFTITDNGEIWICMDNNGIVRVSGTKITQFSPAVLPAARAQVAAGQTGSDTVWFVGGSELFNFDGENWLSVSEQPFLYAPTYLWVGAGDNIWCAMNGDMLHFNGTSWYAPVHRQATNIVASRDLVPRVWISVPDIGIYEYQDTAQQRILIRNDALISNSIKDITFDNSGHCWISTNVGIQSFDQETWSYYSELLPYGSVSIAPRSDGSVLFADGNKLLRFHQGVWDTLQVDNLVSGENIEQIFVDRSGWLWLDTTKGVLFFDGFSWQEYRPESSPLPSNDITAICQDSSGNIVFATRNDGVAILSLGGWKIYDSDNSALNAGIYDCATDGDGKLWLGAYDGVYCLQDSTWLHFNSQNSDIKDGPNMHCRVDSHSSVWFTQLWSLWKYDGFSWSSYTESDGLDFGQISYFEIDQDNNKWITSTNGVHLMQSARAEVFVPLSRIDLGKVAPGESAARSFYVTNRGTEQELAIRSIAVDGGMQIQLSPNSASVPAGDSILVQLEYQPSSGKIETGTITIRTNDRDRSIGVTADASLSAELYDSSSGSFHAGLDAEKLTFWIELDETYMKANSLPGIWGKAGSSLPFSAAMDYSGDSTRFETEIANQFAGGTEIIYYFIVQDYYGNKHYFPDGPKSPVEQGTFYKVNIGQKGDLDTNGEINIFDLLTLLARLGDKNSTEFYAQGDLNSDGKFDIFDLLELLKLIRGH